MGLLDFFKKKKTKQSESGSNKNGSKLQNSDLNGESAPRPLSPLHKDQNLNLYSGGDGSSVGNAIVIHSSQTFEGISLEYTYIESIYGEMDKDWFFLSQRLIEVTGKLYDVIEISFKGKILLYYFDINNFFGKK